MEEFYGKLMEDFPIAASEIVKKQSRNPIRNATIAKVEWGGDISGHPFQSDATDMPSNNGR